MLSLRVQVDLGAMAMKEYSAFSRAPGLLSLTIKLFNVISWIIMGESYLSAEMQSVYSAAPADWASISWTMSGVNAGIQ